jgi:hypothetical protein
MFGSQLQWNPSPFWYNWLYLKTGTPQFWLLGGVWIGVLAA